MRWRDDIRGSLDAVVADMRRGCAALEQSLHDERAALDRADADALDEAGVRKTAALQRLEALDAERRHLAAHPEAGQLAMPDGWDELLSRLEACRGLNAVNGRIVESRMAHVREAIALITGAERAAPLYGPGGRRVDAPMSMTRSRA